jgi:hypothetical protein
MREKVRGNLGEKVPFKSLRGGVDEIGKVSIIIKW